MHEADAWRPGDLDEWDGVIFKLYGVVMSEVQRFEFALGAVLEAQDFDLEASTVEQRMPHYEAIWRMTAGQLRAHVSAPVEVASDLQELVQLRNRLAHNVLLEYGFGRHRTGLKAVGEWRQRLRRYALVFNSANHRLLAIAEALQEARPDKPNSETVMRLWQPSPLVELEEDDDDSPTGRVDRDLR